MIDMNLFLSVLLYVAGIILLIVLIILGIKMIFLVDRANSLLDNIEGKVNSLNGIFSVVDKVSFGLGSITDHFVDNAKGIISKVFGNKKSKESEEIIDE